MKRCTYKDNGIGFDKKTMKIKRIRNEKYRKQSCFLKGRNDPRECSK
jgi:hypothetical protein